MIKTKKSKAQVAAENFELNVFNHDNMENDLAACGIDSVEFAKKQDFLNGIVKNIDESKNFISQLAEAMENTFTAREIGYMNSKLSLINMIQEFEKKGGNRALTKEPNTEEVPKPKGTE